MTRKPLSRAEICKQKQVNQTKHKDSNKQHLLSPNHNRDQQCKTYPIN